MYRAPDNAPRCPVCGMSNLTPETAAGATEGWSFVRFGVLSGPTKMTSVNVTRARLCLDCGYVMHFVSQGELRYLRGELATLTPYP